MSSYYVDEAYNAINSAWRRLQRTWHTIK